MEHNEIIETTSNFLQKYIGDKELKLTDRIFTSKLINSLFAMQLVLFLEKEYQFSIDNKDLNLKNFDTLDAIAKFVLGKLNG